MKEITIKVDTNDGDYAIEVSLISEEDLQKIFPLVEAISKFTPYKTVDASGFDRRHRHNYPCGEMLRDDLGEKSPEELYGFDEETFEVFENLLPSLEYGFHTIVSIEYCEIREKIKLL